MLRALFYSASAAWASARLWITTGACQSEGRKATATPVDNRSVSRKLQAHPTIWGGCG